MRNSEDASDRKNIQSVERALNIIKFIGQANNSAGLTTISEGVGLSHSTTHNLLRTLKKSGFIIQYEPTGKYSLGLILLELAKVIQDNLDLRPFAKVALHELTEKYDETTHLAVLSDDEVVYVEKVESSKSIRLMSYVGKRNPAYCTGVGKALLSGLNEEKLERVLRGKKLESRTEKTITDQKTLKKELRQVASSGYALDQGEFEEGMHCVAAPVKNHLGHVVAAISISFPANRIERFNKDEIIHDVMEKALSLSIQLGFKP